MPMPWSDWPRNVRLLMGMRAARSVGQGAMVAAFALYLHALGWGATDIGAVLTAALLLGAALTLLVGPLSDRGGRRAFLIGYDLLQALAALVALFTATPWLLVAAAVLGAYGRGANGSAGAFAPVEQAWLAIELPVSQRARVFSANSAIGFAGMGVGALLAALPAAWLGADLRAADYRWLFFLPLAGALVSVALLLCTREPVLAKAPPAAHPAAEHRLRRDENRLLARLMLANALNGLGIGLTGPLIAYWFAVRFRSGLDHIGLGLALGFAVAAASAWLAGRAADRHGILRTVVWMRAAGLLMLVAMPLVPWFWGAMALYVLRGASNRGTAGVRQALAAGLTRAERRGLASTVQNLSLQLPRAIGPLLGGALFHAGHLALPFFLGAALQAGYLLLFVVFFRGTEAAVIAPGKSPARDSAAAAPAAPTRPG
ncbi:MAG: MFS transporter [Burkholderiales bacterium]|nr:MFS transporter [Burkholderiales bacterium]HMN57814.1 MFS transporter [Ottowia sp.]